MSKRKSGHGKTKSGPSQKVWIDDYYRWARKQRKRRYTRTKKTGRWGFQLGPARRSLGAWGSVVSPVRFARWLGIPLRRLVKYEHGDITYIGAEAFLKMLLLINVLRALRKAPPLSPFQLFRIVPEIPITLQKELKKEAGKGNEYAQEMLDLLSYLQDPPEARKDFNPPTGHSKYIRYPKKAEVQKQVRKRLREQKHWQKTTGAVGELWEIDEDFEE